VYRLTIKDCLKLQGFDEHSFELVGSEKSHWQKVGNTIPTNLTRLVGKAVDDIIISNKRDHLNEIASSQKSIVEHFQTKKMKMCRDSEIEEEFDDK